MKLSNKQIRAMLEELVEEIDHDIAKSYFVYDAESDEYRDPQDLIEIVKKYL